LKIVFFPDDRSDLVIYVALSQYQFW